MPLGLLWRPVTAAEAKATEPAREQSSNVLLAEVSLTETDMNSEEGGNGASPSVVPSPESSEQTAASQFRFVEGTQVVTLDSMSEDDAGQEADALSGSPLLLVASFAPSSKARSP